MKRDYNEKPKCEHFYTEWTFAPNPIECAGVLTFKCDKCGEVITLNCSEKMCRDVSDRYGEGYAQGYIDGSTGADWKGGAE